jgi:cytoskeletal protein CcmA (bactofilin family)
MFGNKKASTTDIIDQVETVIGKDTQFKGTINAKGSVRIDGQFEGEVITTADVVVGDTGRITAQVKGRNALVAGVITGNCEISDKLELLSSGKIFGDIKVGTLIIGEGAVFKGGCIMQHGEEAVATKTKVK